MRAPTPLIDAVATEARLIALPGIPLINPGDDLAAIIVAALRVASATLQDGDILVVAQKIVSKAEGRMVDLATVQPSPRAQELARAAAKDPRLVELILRESTEVVRCRRNVLIVSHRLGFVTANAGIDVSNVKQAGEDSTALLLPEDPDASCASLRARLRSMTGADVAVIMNDSHGRAFRNGTVGVAIGASGLAALVDRRGEPDLFGRPLQTTEVGFADEIAGAASMLMGQAGEGRPVVLIRGLPFRQADGSAKQLVRPKELDLFLAPPRPAANHEPVEHIIRSRRSVRHYRPQPVPEATVEDILQSAICAPSAHNRQPWRFAVIYDDATKRELARSMGERLQADRRADGDAEDVIARDVERSYVRITSAPVVILVCLSMEDMDVYPDDRRNACERQMAVQSTAAATQNILLAAHAASLGASSMCAPLFCPETVRAVLGLAPDWEPQTLVTLGYPAGEPRPFRRRPLSQVMRVVKLGS